MKIKVVLNSVLYGGYPRQKPLSCGCPVCFVGSEGSLKQVAAVGQTADELNLTVGVVWKPFSGTSVPPVKNPSKYLLASLQSS